MFSGEYSHAIDKKGRLIIPSRFREILTERYEEKFIMTKGLDTCLLLYPADEWNELEKKMKEVSTVTNPSARAFKRFMIAGAIECTVDKQGRIMIPSNLRVYAQITRDVVITGNLEKVEIWAKERWQEYWKASKPIEELAREIGEDVKL
ncbi:cell division/cell wall cluster transcriptional repressor MraZ [Candidatus Desantisbacteria bacterium CG_4_10_14_0_8_um_filter_48_22]|uniref:Transcriptional regulator MraZ n=1 Tax=Candidatus Desantisbacteria bacterium CG_4_10_14_0_8_um_filter_48_22 TaxID=1974543 RepID=A0A2M7SER8_9BACT|nr:MAG: cell division/cell wall cluster transcriptional repressor MraZ [Candidatus Desantisbacteria bacterium CG1_02_49_89]PIZ17961.1 MAG: cell division/cell wall cluster transcriptional repressor MraZ [Candidatus Desantisbacteria bacterium CG_4_10_14_0_8_um_filter_48_22]PJB27760.1 MAG: cell division/cell wall cluster transcriptional repressor MraZ [Candidatus Desantisbacteria bacterium CG_4_9_14_3_um_filter_50_7]